MDDIYASPKAELDQAPEPEENLSASERLRRTRRHMQATAARDRLVIVWGIRLVADGVALAWLSYVSFFGMMYQSPFGIAIFVFMASFLLGEIVAIGGFFQRKKWCLIPLHIYSGISLLNLPVGTILSIIHFLNAGKLELKG